MTTIAYREGFLAADTLACVGGSKMGHVVKIVRRADGCLAGAAGYAGYVEAFKAWFMAGEASEPPTAKQDEHVLDRGVIFRPGGSILVFEPEGICEMQAPYFAFGAGREYALGAMFVGASAAEAVRAAIEHDPHTGGNVTILTHAGA